MRLSPETTQRKPTWKKIRLCSVAYLGYGRHDACHGRHLDGGRKNCLAKIKIFMYSFLNLYFAPHARDVKRLDGARDNKQVWRPHVRTWGLSGSICTVLKKVLMTLLGLFGAPRSDSAPLKSGQNLWNFGQNVWKPSQNRLMCFDF